MICRFPQVERTNPSQWLESTRITEAVLEDIPQLSALLGELFDQESDFTPDQGKQHSGLKLVIENPDFGKIFVARRESLVVGMINLLLVPNARQGGQAVLFEDLVVKREFRGQGIASALLEHAFKFAVALGAVQSSLLTDSDNYRAIQLYRKFGFSRLSAKPMRLAV